MKDNKPVNLNPAEYERNAFCHILGRGVDWQEVFDRNYWENVAFKLRPDDAIEVHSHDHRVKFVLHLLDVNHRCSPPHMEMVAQAIYPANLRFPTAEAGERHRFTVRAMRGSAKEYEIYDAVEGIVIRDHLNYQIGLDTAGALELDAQHAEKMTAATAAAAALAKPERHKRVERREV